MRGCSGVNVVVGEGGELCLQLWGVCSFCSAGINVAHVSASSLFITFQHRQSHFYDFPVSIYVFLFIFFSFLWLFEKCFQFFASVDKTTKAKVERKKSSGSVRKSLNWKFIWPFLLVFHCRTCSCPATTPCGSQWSVKRQSSVASCQSVSALSRQFGDCNRNFAFSFNCIYPLYPLATASPSKWGNVPISIRIRTSISILYAGYIRLRSECELTILAWKTSQCLSGTRSSLGSLIVVRFWHWLISWAWATVINAGTCS